MEILKCWGKDIGWSDNALGNWAHFFGQIPEDGLAIAGDREWAHNIRFWPNLYNLALLELFGLVTIQHGATKTGQGWQIERVWRRPLGDGLLALLATYIRKNFSDIFQGDDPSDVPFGILRPLLSPYFPDWHNTLSFPDFGFQEGEFIFKVSLWKGEIWRRIALISTCTLDELATMIIRAYDFDFDHLYQFTYSNRFGGRKRVAHPYIKEVPATDEVELGELPLQLGTKMEFVYDFGDNWTFEVTLEQINPSPAIVKAPQVIETHGESPTQYGW